MHHFVLSARIRIVTIFMLNDFQKLFDQLPTSEPKSWVLDKVMNRIARSQRISVLTRGFFYLFTLIGSIATFVPAIRSLISDLASSGFLSYLSLILSDARIVLTSWQSFGLALLESVPMLSIVFTLVVLLVFLESLKYLVQMIRPLSAVHGMKT